MSILFASFIIAVILLFTIGVYSLLMTRNLMRILISVEILTKGVTLLLIAIGYVTGRMAAAQAYVITIIVIEVVLLAIATGIILGAYRKNDTLNTGFLNNLKG
ncbi:MAG: NADH-quinone oxidoreductase subunit K [Bacillota bacterium]|nr:NADH-quinone oxidoreductase subunit K [Bacillota bacterium]